MFSPARGIDASHVYCVGDVPVVCFFDLDGKPQDVPFRTWADALRRKIWNQGLVTVVLVLSEQSLSAFSVLEKEETEVKLSLSEATPLGAWSALDFATSNILRRLPNWFNPELRVDRRLLDNLSQVVDQIEGPKLGREAAEALMAQVVFIRYLECRGIVGEHYRAHHNLRGIEDLIRNGDGGGIDDLLGQLASTFNGDFLNSHGNGPPRWANLNSYALAQIGRFLAGENLETGQKDFWGYDFAIIPVELLSSIYESFLAERQKDQGAYYTPRHLATMAVEQAFRHVTAPHEASVLDGACGSGILLTTAYQKMLSSAEAAAGAQLSFSERVKLLINNIHGADLDPTACWITAFSLYLCLLDRLTPADIALLQEDENTKLPPLVGTTPAANIVAGVTGDFFYGGEKRRNFDVLVSNPPWREATGDLAAFEKFIATDFEGAPVPDRQIAAAYAYEATRRVHEGGSITLILPLNLWLGLESFGFRQRLLELMEVERVINFADLRHLLFPNAKNSCAMVVGKLREDRDGAIFHEKERIEYLTPKADPRIALGTVAVTQNDRVFVSPLEAYNSPATFIRRYWGREEDIGLLSRVEKLGSLRAVINQRGWLANKGFHKTDTNNPSYSLDDPDWKWLGDLPFLGTRRVPKDHPLVAADTDLPLVKDIYTHVATPGGAQGALYKGPRVVWRNGLSRDLRVRAIFSDRSFAFQHTACCIGGPEADANLLRFLTAYLRSDLATYFINLTSFSAIADRQAVSKTEILDLPFWTPECHPTPEAASAVIEEVSQFFDRLGAIPEWLRGQAFEDATGWLNKVIFSYFGVQDQEAELVRQTARLVSPSVQPGSYKALANPLNSFPSQELMQTYLHTLSNSLQDWQDSRHGLGRIQSEVLFNESQSALGIVHLAVGDGQDGGTKSDAYVPILKWLNRNASQRGGIGYLLEVPDLIVADGADIYLMKPMQSRYWGARAALADTERLVAGINAAAR